LIPAVEPHMSERSLEADKPILEPRVRSISTLSKRLVRKRERERNPKGGKEAELRKRTLINLYNERPTWLDLAHQRLDQAVLDAYGWPQDLSDDEILERLLALNLERTAKQEETRRCKNRL